MGNLCYHVGFFTSLFLVENTAADLPGRPPRPCAEQPQTRLWKRLAASGPGAGDSRPWPSCPPARVFLWRQRHMAGGS